MGGNIGGLGGGALDFRVFDVLNSRLSVRSAEGGFEQFWS